MGGDGGEHPGGARGDEGEGVDLAVRMGEGDADLGAAVLEAVDLLDALAGGEFGGAVAPGGEDEGGALLVEVGEGGQVVGGEADDLAAAGVAGEGGEAVLEDDHLVVGGRDLARASLGGGAERAGVGGRVVGAALPVGGDDDPVAEQRIAPYLGAARGGGRVERTRVGEGSDGAVAGVVVEDLAAVGEAGTRALHGRNSLTPG